MNKKNAIFIIIGCLLILLSMASFARYNGTSNNVGAIQAPSTPLIDTTPKTLPTTPTIVTIYDIAAAATLVPPPIIGAEHAFIGLIDTHQPTTIVPLFQKDAWTPAPIASITKLLTARAALATVSATDTITISPKAEAQYEHTGDVKAGEHYTREQLLYPLLISSSNDAAYAFAEQEGIRSFIKNMQDDAHTLGASTTNIINVTGLDGVEPNTASAFDIATIMAAVVRMNPELIHIEHMPTYSQTIASGKAKQYTTTNTLLNENLPQGWSIIAGKTGETPKAKQALVLAIQTPQSHIIALTVVLRATDRVVDMHALIDWLQKAYTW